MAALLEDRIAVVTGAACGIGREVCLKAAEYGASIVALDRDPAGAKATADEVNAFGGTALYAECDVSNRVDVNAAFELALDRFGRVDMVSNNACVRITAAMTDVTEEQWDRSFDMNCKGAMFVCQSAAKIMKEQNFGRIVVTASQFGTEDAYENNAYATSMAVLPAMIRGFAAELSRYNVLSNVVSPGYTDTRLFRNGMAERAKREGRPAQEVIAELLRGVPIGRICHPEEVAELICFLGSEKNAYISGTDIQITGGKIMH